jgi:hypothetical protein
MRRRISAILTCIAFLLGSTSFAQDRDVTSRDLHGVSKGHRYFWAIAGGTAVGMGIGIIAPGGSKSAFKGALIGGSAASAFYLIKDPRAAGDDRALAHIVTNTLLGTGIFWTVCNCSAGAWSGAFIGGGGTAIIQAFGTHNRSLAKLGGTAQSTPPSTPATPSTPTSTSTPVVAGQSQNAPAQPANQPAQAQTPSAQNAPVQPQNDQAQTPAQVAPQNSSVQTQDAPAAQTQSAPASAQADPAAQNVPAQGQSVAAPAQSVPAQTQSVPASTQGDPAGTQSAPAQTQNPPIQLEELSFTSDSNSNGNRTIGSASLQTAPPKPQGQRP